MKKTLFIAVLAALAIWMTGCGAPAANNANSNANANTAKPTAAAPTADAFLDMEKKAQEAYTKADGAYFEGWLALRLRECQDVDVIRGCGCSCQETAASGGSAARHSADVPQLNPSSAVDGNAGVTR